MLLGIVQGRMCHELMLLIGLTIIRGKRREMFSKDRIDGHLRPLYDLEPGRRGWFERLRLPKIETGANDGDRRERIVDGLKVEKPGQKLSEPDDHQDYGIHCRICETRSHRSPFPFLDPLRTYESRKGKGD